MLASILKLKMCHRILDRWKTSYDRFHEDHLRERTSQSGVVLLSQSELLITTCSQLVVSVFLIVLHVVAELRGCIWFHSGVCFEKM